MDGVGLESDDVITGKSGKTPWDGESPCLFSSQRKASEDASGTVNQPGGREDGGGAGPATPLPAHDQA